MTFIVGVGILLIFNYYFGFVGECTRSSWIDTTIRTT